MIATAAEKLFRIPPEERSNWLAYSTIYSGWLRIEEGSSGDGCRLITEGLAVLDALGVGYFHQFLLLLLAHEQLRSDKIGDALDTLDRAEALKRSGQKWCEAEVHRLRGDLQLAGSATPEAETSYLRALVPVHRTPSSGKSARQPHSAASGAIKASATRPATFSLRSTIGSPRDLTHRTSWTRSRFWTSCSKAR